MDQTTLILAILIPIAALIATLLVLYILFINKKKKRLKKLEELNSIYAPERIQDIERTFNRISSVAQTNPKFRSASVKLDLHWDNINGRNSRIETILYELEDKVKVGRIKEDGKIAVKGISSDEFRKQTKTLEDLIKQLNQQIAEFREVAAQVTHQDEFIQSDFLFYQKQLRKINEVYAQKRVLLDRISPNIEILRDKIKQTERDFHEVVINLDLEQSDEILRKYAKYTQKLAQVVTEGPSIQAHLYVQIPEIVKRLNETYLAKKKDINTSFDAIDFKSSIEKIAERFQEAKKEFAVLNIEKSKELIKGILKSIKVLERLINFEIKSRNVFVTSYEEVIAEAKVTLENYVSIKKQLKEVSGSGKQIPIETIEKFEEIRTMGQEVDAQALKFRELMLDQETAYSSKLARMKTLVNSCIELNKLINELIEMLWSLNIENSITKNKFKRAEAALNEIISNVKTENIKMTEADKKEFEYISNEITNLSKLISGDNIAKETVERVDSISKRVTSFYSAMSGNIQIGKHIKNMILELSPKRALDVKLNIQLQNVERLFLEGEYAQALNYIIDYLERGNK